MAEGRSKKDNKIGMMGKSNKFEAAEERNEMEGKHAERKRVSGCGFGSRQWKKVPTGSADWRGGALKTGQMLDLFAGVDPQNQVTSSSPKRWPAERARESLGGGTDRRPG